jgi:hypothetical protein
VSDDLKAFDWRQFRLRKPGRRARTGWVYFVLGVPGAIKIGFATTVHKRVAALQNACPVPLKILARTRGDMALEREYHRRFAEHALHGEWFKDCRAIRAEIKRLAKPKEFPGV